MQHIVKVALCRLVNMKDQCRFQAIHPIRKSVSITEEASRILLRRSMTGLGLDFMRGCQHH